MLVRRVFQLGIIFILVATLRAQTAAPAEGTRENALALEQQGKNVEAEEAWRTFLKVHPSDPEPYAHLGVLEARQEHYKAAVADYRKALARGPGLPGLRLNLGLALFKSGDLKGAIQEFQPLLNQTPESSPDNLRLTILVGMAHYGLGEYAQAAPYLKSATERDPNNLELLLALEHSYLWSKQTKDVMDVYQHILSLNAESAEADMLAGEALDEMSDRQGAVKMFRAAIAANPKDADAYFGLGILLHMQMKFAEALPEFQAAVDNAPADARARVYLADCYIHQNDNQHAQPELERALKDDPTIEMGQLDLGGILAAQGHDDAAVTHYIAATKLAPQDAEPHWRLSRLYREMGQTDKAREETVLVGKLKTQEYQSLHDQVQAAANARHALEQQSSPDQQSTPQQQSPPQQ